VNDGAPRVRAVLFDAVGTLIEPNPSVAALYQAAAERYAVTLQLDEIRGRFRRSVAQRFEEDLVDVATGLPTRHATSQAWEVERWRRIVADVLPEVADQEALFQNLWSQFAQPANWRLFDDVADCWNSLSKLGITIGVASNFDDRLHSVRAGFPVLRQCEHVFISSSLGYRKPSRHFYDAIAEQLNVEPDLLMMIGDDRQGDFTAARSAGWQAIHLDRKADQHMPGSIRSLAELSRILAGA